MDPIILVGIWIAIMGVVVSQNHETQPETLYKVEECDCKGKCKTVLEVKESP